MTDLNRAQTMTLAAAVITFLSPSLLPLLVSSLLSSPAPSLRVSPLSPLLRRFCARLAPLFLSFSSLPLFRARCLLLALPPPRPPPRPAFCACSVCFTTVFCTP